MTDDPVARLLPQCPEPQPGPKWLSMTPRQRRQWEDKQWTDRDPDYDGPPLVSPPQPKNHIWLLFVMFVVMGIIVVTFDLTTKEFLLGLSSLLVGLALGAISGESRVTRANERDPVRTVWRTVQWMNENGHWVFTRQEELAVEKLQRILKRFRERLPR